MPRIHTSQVLCLCALIFPATLTIDRTDAKITILGQLADSIHPVAKKSQRLSVAVQILTE